MSPWRVRVWVVGLFFGAIATAGAQDSRIDAVLNQLEKVHHFSGVSIAPNGKAVAWIGETAGGGQAVFLDDLNKPSAEAKRIHAGEEIEHNQASGIAWSADSTAFAFFSHSTSGSDSGQDQIYVVRPGHGLEAKQITKLSGYAKSLEWSQDGTSIAFLYAEHGGGAGPLAAVPAQVGVIGSDIHNQRITTVAGTGGELKQMTPAELNVYEYDWSQTGEIAAIAAPGPADNNWWTAKLYRVSPKDGKMTLLYAPPADRQIAAPHWSPDGTRIALLGGIMSDEGFDGGDVFVLPRTGGEAQDVTDGMKASATGLRWRGDGKLLLTEALEGGGAISVLDLKTHETEMLWQGGQELHEDGNYPNLSIAADGATSAAVRSDWAQAPEVAAGRIGDWKDITSANANQKASWGKAESIKWKNGEYQAQGWLLYPANFDAAKHYPMVVEIHGGPSSERSASWPSAHFDMSVMASVGYFVFFPNPRGSYGEGEAFTKANVKDFGHGDLQDILTGLDAVAKKAPINENRIGVTGWSYGGFMTMWTVTQTNRFRAAVAGAGIADWQSYYGENSIDQWMIPFFGASVYDDPAVYAKSSPINYIKQVKTPTLVVVGERDGECPAPQSFEFWHALKAQGVPTQLVVYPGEGHSFREAKDRLDVVKRAAAWFDKYLQ